MTIIVDTFDIFKSKVNKFICKYGLYFLTEHILRMLLIETFKIKANKNNRIEMPYVSNKSDDTQAILNNGTLLKKGKNFAHLDLVFRKRKLNNYVEIKMHIPKKEDDQSTKFGEVLNDLHRLAYISSGLPNDNNKYYFVYLFSNLMMEKSRNWDELFKCNIHKFIFQNNSAEKIYLAIDYINKNDNFWDQKNNAPKNKCKEFRKHSFRSFVCKSEHEEESETNWRPNDCSFLNKIVYSKEKCERIENNCYLLLVEVKNKQI